ncbi:MAG: hypothetical protein RLZZ136_1220, partial [Pseudomonadota bacterium]
MNCLKHFLLRTSAALMAAFVVCAPALLPSPAAAPAETDLDRAVTA